MTNETIRAMFVDLLVKAAHHQNIDFDSTEANNYYVATCKEEYARIQKEMRADMEAANLFGADLEKLAAKGKPLPALVQAAGTIALRHGVTMWVQTFLDMQPRKLTIDEMKLRLIADRDFRPEKVEYWQERIKAAQAELNQPN